MITFWIGTLLLLLIAAVLVIYPLMVTETSDDEAQRDELNKAFYKQRVQELEAEEQAGVVTHKDELVTDLKQSLLDDIPNDSDNTKADLKSVKWVALPAMLFLIGLSYFMYSLYGSQDQVKAWQQVEQRLPELSKRLMDPNGNELTDKEMSDWALAMRTRLQRFPDDVDGWMILGRVSIATQDLNTAIGALTRADKLSPDNPEIQLSLAQALLFSADQADIEKATNILQVLLHQPQVDLRVYSLLAFNAYNNGDYPQAIKYWRQLQQGIGQEDERYAMLERSINTAQREMAGQQSLSGSQASSETQASVEEAQGTPVSVTISLGDNVPQPKDGVVIVSIHTADGAPMPVAAARYPLEAFPMTVVLDDRNSMIESRKLSTLSDIMVRARIDSDGNVSTRDNDWYGESQPVKLGDDVVMSINSQY